MALLDTSSGGAVLDVTSPLNISNYPFTFACWVRRTGSPGDARPAMGLGSSAGGENYYYLRHNQSYYPQTASRYNGGPEDRSTDSAAIIGTGVWVPFVGVWTASNDRLLHRGGPQPISSCALF